MKLQVNTKCQVMTSFLFFLTTLLIIHKVVQGFLVVSYNLGDGDYSVSLPSYHIDNGEWHHITLERNENEFTLRLYEGGGRREILKAAGIYKEIVIDPSSLVLGNTYPFNQTKSFQGEEFLISLFRIWTCINEGLLALHGHIARSFLVYVEPKVNRFLAWHFAEGTKKVIWLGKRYSRGLCANTVSYCSWNKDGNLFTQLYIEYL